MLLTLARGPEEWGLQCVLCLLFLYLQKDECVCQECSRVLPNIFHDPDTGEECASWDVMAVDSARIYQAMLERRRTRYARPKRQGSVGASGSRIRAGDTPHGTIQEVCCLRQCLASSRPISPKPMARSRVQEALLAEGARGGTLEHKPLNVRSGKCATVVDV
ncbi:hypothetical protein E2C01_018105 [Portunus trituberculatus]|uniref:Uncharacterized protein n=1 Tax=Portunus trituberculatus TaxID=210409 RepID=A0A5B7DU80_PORTR|nr:hypothetical protein [Portunus trituberculatus]